MEAQTMSWINEHKDVWRVVLLVVILVALMGPWIFDQILVPSGFSCSDPTIRLDDDFCGTPLPGTWLLYWMIVGFVYASAGLVMGSTSLVDWIGVFRFSLLVFPLVLPFFSTPLLILPGDRRRRHIFNIVAWGLAAGIALWIGITSYPRLFWVLWGNWLYIGLAASVLILDVLTLAVRRRLSQG
jgi:hypothetical protein